MTERQRLKADARAACQVVAGLLGAALRADTSTDTPEIKSAMRDAASAWERAGNRSEAAKWRWAAEN